MLRSAWVQRAHFNFVLCSGAILPHNTLGALDMGIYIPLERLVGIHIANPIYFAVEGSIR